MNVGDVLAGRYELLAEVGAGGMGRVLRARDRTLGRTVAVKLLAPHMLGDEHAVAALRDEAQRAAGVRHPNVVQVLDAVLDDTDQPAIVMEYVDGPSLAEVIPAHGMDIEEAMEVLRAVGSGLAAVHANGLVHRDVSPGNVLIDNGVPRLTDFGIARSSTATATTTIQGSVPYLAPEQADGRPVGPAADVYALGCLATKLFTGKPPFRADHPVGVVHQHLSKPAPDITQARPDVPPQLAAAVAAALEKDPADRPGSVQELLDMLGLTPTRSGVGSAVGGAGTPASEATRLVAARGDATRVLDEMDATGTGLEQPGKDDRTRPSRALVLGVVLVLALAGLAVAALSMSGTEPPAVTASPTTAPSPPPSPSPSPSPLPPAEAALAALDELRGLLDALRGEGELTQEAWEELDERATKAQDKVLDGKPDDAAKEMRELRKDLTEQVTDGEATAAAEDAVLAQVREVEEALDALVEQQESDAGDDEADDDDDEADDDGDDDDADDADDGDDTPGNGPPDNPGGGPGSGRGGP